MSTLPKIVFAVVSPLALLLAPSLALAQTKVGTISFERVVFASPQYQAGQAQMNKEFEKKKHDLEAEGRKLQEDIDKYQKEAYLIAPDEKSKREKELATRKIDFDQKQRQAQEEVQKRDSELSLSLRKKLQDTIDAVAKERGFAIIINNPIVTSPEVDISQDVLLRLGWTPAPAKK